MYSRSIKTRQQLTRKETKLGQSGAGLVTTSANYTQKKYTWYVSIVIVQITNRTVGFSVATCDVL